MSALPPKTVKALSELYGGGPRGLFLQGRYGITHFILEEPAGANELAKLAVLSHGLGTSTSVYEGPVTSSLVAAGYRVLRYDFLGHGWSHSNIDFLKYDKDIFIEQLDELLNHILAPGAPVDLWVGHSTGGLLGVLAANSGMRVFKDLALISPAFWANKPLIARIADQIPSVVHGLVSRVASLKALPEDAYAENNDKAFAAEDGKYLYPEAHKVAGENIKNMFRLHPQAAGAILGISCFFLREDLLLAWRSEFKSLLESKQSPRVCLIWGQKDIVVPFEFAKEVVSWAGSPHQVSLVSLNLGHEAPVEDPVAVATEIVKFTRPMAKM